MNRNIKKCVLLDASTINRGGSIQVALSTIHYAIHEKKYAWHLLATRQLAQQIPNAMLKRLTSYRIIRLQSKIDRVYGGLVASIYCNKIKPDIVYSIIGPVYWRPKCTHIQGFASPLLIYPKSEYVGIAGSKISISEGLQNALKRRQFVKSDYIITETNTVRQMFSRKYRFPLDRVFVVENGHSPWIKRFKIRNKSSTNRPVIFVPSGYYPHKNLDAIPFVASKIKGNGVSVLFRFLLSCDSIEWKCLFKSASKLGVGDMLETIGPINHAKMRKYYKEATVVFLPTMIEASTAVYPESFAAKVPLITSDKKFARELCGNAALYVDPLNVESMANGILEVIGNEKMREKMIRRGANVLKRNYPTPLQKWKKVMGVLDTVIKREERWKND